MFVVSMQEKDYDWQPYYLLYAGEDQDVVLKEKLNTKQSQ